MTDTTDPRKQLLEAMSAVSEDRTCTGWAADWARTLHAEGGIWEALGRAVGWPTGNYDAWVWVSWEEAARLYGHEPSPASAVVPAADRTALRDRIADALWAAAEHNVIAEWICCDPIDPKHGLCSQGDAALRMLKALIVDDPEAWKPAPLPDAVLSVLPAPADRAAVLEEAADAVAAMREETFTNVAVYPLYDGQQKIALSNAESMLRRMAAGSAVVDRVAAETPPAETLDDYERTTGHLITCLAVAGGASDPDCPACRPAVEAQPGKDTETPVIRCNHAHLRHPHDPHGWEPQPGMDPIHCPGLTAEQQPKEA